MKDPIDTAIDQVAARMVQVREDEDLALRIASALPERSSRFGWLVPQFAAIAAFAIAAVVWSLRGPATPSLLPSSDVVAVMAVPNTVAAVEPGTAVRALPLESAFARHVVSELRRDRLLGPLELLEPFVRVDGVDHERSLAPIETMSALVMRDMDPDALPGSPALVLAPIAITELPLTAESFSPR